MSSSQLPLSEDELARFHEPLIRKVAGSHRSLLNPYFSWDDLLATCRFTFVKAMRKWTPDGGASLAHYCARAMSNACVQARQRAMPKGFRGRELAEGEVFPTVWSLDRICRQEDDDEGTFGDEIAADIDVATEAIANAARPMWRQFVRDALAHRPRELRIVLMRYGFDDGIERSLDEIGSALGMSNQSVSNSLRRIHRWLRKAAVEQGLADEAA